MKIKLGYDDSLDVFGIHGVGGIVGALGTGDLQSPRRLGGIKGDDYLRRHRRLQFMIQLTAVVITVVWCGIVSAILYKLRGHDHRPACQARE